MVTAYEQSVEAAKEVYRREAREREQAGHKAAARIWFNALTEFWPPENTEMYWLKVSDKFAKMYDEYKDNELLKELLLMTYAYLGNVAEAADEVIKNGKQD